MPQQSPNEQRILSLLVNAANLNWSAEDPSDGSEGRCQTLTGGLKHKGLL